VSALLSHLESFSFWKRPENRLALQMRTLFLNETGAGDLSPGLAQAGRELLNHFSRMNWQIRQGGNPESLARTSFEWIYRFCDRHHEGLLNHLLQRGRLEGMIEALPELSDVNPSLMVGSFTIRTEPTLNSLARVAHFIHSREVSGRLRRQWEDMLWDVSSPQETEPTRQIKNRLELKNRLLEFYLRHRPAFVSAASRRSLDLEELHENDRDDFGKFFELDVYPSELSSRRRQTLARALTLQNYQGHVIFRYEGPGRNIHEQLLTVEDMRKVEQAFQEGRSVEFAENPGHSILASQVNGIEALTRETHLRFLLLSRIMHPNFFRLTELLGPNLNSAFHQRVQSALQRAATLLASGIEPAEVYRQLRTRFLSDYDKVRKTILDQINYIEASRELLEMQLVSDESVNEMLENWNISLKTPIKLPELAEARKALALLLHPHIRPEVRAYAIKNAHLEDHIVRLYFEYRDEVSPDRLTYPKPVTGVELDAILKDELIQSVEVQNALLHTIHLPTFHRYNGSEASTLVRINGLIFRQSRDSKLQQEFTDHLRAVAVQSLDNLTNAAIHFYRIHRERIRLASVEK
ncbi:MAG: hypothetical protein JNK65_02710, partial [Deltaproteobacteria bacterium]|nr:hypothetical protein [Deltaproteobacteria bacterium]